MAFNWRDFLKQLFLGRYPSAPAPIPPPSPPVPPPTSSFAAQLLVEHNRVRESRGLPPYVNDAVLVRIAQAQAEFQADRDQIGHYGPGGNSVWDRLSDAGYAWSSAGENAAAGQRDAREAVEDWLTSAGHRANVLGNYAEIGGGMAQSSRGTRYWTVVYATPRATWQSFEEAPAALGTEPIQMAHGLIV